MNDSIEALKASFAPILTVLRTRRAELRQIPRLATARPGFSVHGDTVTPALVLAFHPPRPAIDESALAEAFGVPVHAVNASPYEQILGATTPSFLSAIARLLDPDAQEPTAFAPPKRGTYRSPTGPHAPKLDPIDADMTVTVCASPDAGWPVFRDFLRKGVAERLTVAMYDFTAPHVETALLAALEGSAAKLHMVFDARRESGGVGGGGLNGADHPERQVMDHLRTRLGARFNLAKASTGEDGAFLSAYHIKVAVADGTRMWLSSGNWQSSNLAPFDFALAGSEPPFPLGRYNRDYHVVVHSAALARCYEGFIEFDATLGGDFGAPVVDEAPDLLVPDEPEPADFAPVRRFQPLTVHGPVKVTPLLTPDNFPKVINGLLGAARKRLWIQNQYLTPDENGENFPEFNRLLELLGQLARKPHFDLRVCLRGTDAANRDLLLAAGIPLASIRRQTHCHAKLMVIDEDKVVVGSHNLSNAGFVANRDASLLFEHSDIAAYFAGIFEEDWAHASPIANIDSFAVRIAVEGEAAPPGFTRVRWEEVFDTPPPVPFPVGPPPVATPVGPLHMPSPVGSPPASARVGSPPSLVPPGHATVPDIAGVLPATPSTPLQPTLIPPSPAALLDLPFFGVEAETGRRTTLRASDVATALRTSAGLFDPDRTRLGSRSSRGFGLGPGVSAEALDEVGWGVVWGASVSSDVKAALRPLLEHRRSESGDALFKEFTYLPGDSPRAFLQRHGVDFGSVQSGAVPFYLLLVAGPDDVPYAFQLVLDVEYRVGRLDLASPEAFRRYAESVVAVETGAVPARERVLHAFGPAHPGDAPTALSVEVLVRASGSWLDEFKVLTAKHRLSSRVDAAEAATKARLLEILLGAGGRPEVLFTAGHGLLFGAGSSRQPGEQGALVTADWDGFAAVDDSCRLAASDLPDDADVRGMVAFLFACFGAGTPATDNFPTREGQALAAKPFTSALPQALLSHPGGAALGVFGHVDRTLTWSLQPPNAPVATEPFARAALHVLAGNRLGAALDDLNQRGATLAATVANSLRAGSPPIDDVELVGTWTQQRDAAAFVLLGDPAARLPR